MLLDDNLACFCFCSSVCGREEGGKTRQQLSCRGQPGLELAVILLVQLPKCCITDTSAFLNWHILCACPWVQWSGEICTKFVFWHHSHRITSVLRILWNAWQIVAPAPPTYLYLGIHHSIYSQLLTSTLFHVQIRSHGTRLSVHGLHVNCSPHTQVWILKSPAQSIFVGGCKNHQKCDLASRGKLVWWALKFTFPFLVPAQVPYFLIYQDVNKSHCNLSVNLLAQDAYQVLYYKKSN